jgi:hypothetical protein
MKSKLLAVVAVVGALAWAVPPAMADSGGGGGGAGALQAGVQSASTEQGAGAAAISKQDATNANTPANVAGGDVTAGPSSANQLANSEAEAKATNDADTSQKQNQDQTVDPGSCSVGCGGAGAAQIGAQLSDTNQNAGALAVSDQNAVNANVPVNVAGGNITSGPSSANQLANSEAEAKASNDADTTQKQTQTQNVDGSSCHVGCGGPGAAQLGVQAANTEQGAASAAISKQNAVNANVPVNVAGGDITSGPSSANQGANSEAEAKSSNDADTTQKQDQTQNVGGDSSCKIGCGGAGGFQADVQLANTSQWTGSLAVSKQNAVNANVPVNVAGGDITSGPSSANQGANSEAEAKSSNDADTTQKQDETQNVGGDSSCKIGCGGAGGFQAGVQLANTSQWAGSLAVSKQNAVNANVPVNVGGGDITSGPSSANQGANSEAEAKSSNDADTTQKQDQTQNVGGDSSCYFGCGGAGAAQIGIQAADTQQWAGSAAISKQNAVNANVPVNVAGGDITSGPSSANQLANSEAEAKSSNDADTTQKQEQDQTVGGDPSCLAGCGGAGGFQLGIQKADTQQWAGSFALSDQNAVNANTPVNVAGGNITSGPSSANQWANSEAEAKSSNDADTTQKQKQDQTVGGDPSCYFGCGGPGGAQIGIQKAETEQAAFAVGLSLQNAVNSNAPHSIAGGNIYAGPSSANQWASSEAEGKAFNDADTFQWASQYQKVG